MIAKKSSSADLERKRFAFFQIGLIVSGALCLVAFEYSSANVQQKVVKVEEPAPDTYSYDDKLLEIIEKPAVEKPAATVIALPTDNVTITARTLPTGTFSASHTVSIIGDGGYGDIGELEPEDIIYEGVDVDPSFPGGNKEMMSFIQSKTQYPQIPREMGIQGIVYVGIIVNKDGSISEVTAKNDLHIDLEKEAKRVVGIMPNWIPGEQAGKPVRVRYVVPINFVIQPKLLKHCNKKIPSQNLARDFSFYFLSNY